MSREIHLLIVWPNAAEKLDYIIKDLSVSFTVKEVFRVCWSDRFYSENLTRFYGQNLPVGSDKETHVGKGIFHAIIFEDSSPNYEERDTTKGILSVNINIFDLKQKYRKLTGGGHKIHATNSSEEAMHDIWLLLGRDADSFHSVETWSGTIKTWSSDLIGADGWNSIQDLFETLNRLSNYIVLRNFEPLPDAYHMKDHGDIDLLVDSLEDCIYYTNAVKAFPGKHRVHYYIKIANEMIPFDFRYVGDRYYDINLQNDLLRERELIRNSFYAPPCKLYFYSLLYHALVHKPFFSNDYADRLVSLARNIDIEFSGNLNEGVRLLASYFHVENYEVTRPVDATVFFREEIAYYIQPNEIEGVRQLASILENTTDLSVLSPELRQYCKDGTSLYHLSSSRANILRPFEQYFTNGDILEIGADCGALTRYLGECGGNITALECNPQRAACAQARTRDLENVTVLPVKLEAFQCRKQFDVITLIGVLEFASLYASGDFPELTVLTCVRKLLKQNGKLIVALDNQLGLRYFAGTPESHTRQPMYGIEGRYHQLLPRSFGRKDLFNILAQSGFMSIEFLSPFPDYKLPVSIITENGLKNKGFDAAALAWQSVRRDPRLPQHCSFSLELAWPEIFRNDLVQDLSNSFLIVALPQPGALVENGTLAYHYSTDRLKRYSKETKFIQSDEGGINVIYNSLDKIKTSISEDKQSIISGAYPAKAKYSLGQPLSLEFIKIITRDGWTIPEVGDFLRRYITILADITQNPTLSLANIKPSTLLPGNCFDLSPQNIIITPNGRAEAIDTEWTLHRSIEAGCLLFRSLLLMMGPITRFGVPASNTAFTRIGFIESALSEISFELNEQQFLEYISLESRVQEAVTGLSAMHFIDWQPMSLLPTKNAFQVLATCEAEIAQRDTEINRLNVVIQEVSDWVKENQFDILHKQLAEKQAELMRMSDWADGMRQQLERRNLLLRKTSNAMDKLKKLGREHLGQTFIGDLVRHIRDKRNYIKNKLTFDIVRKSIEENDGKLIITFPIITWDFRWQRPQHIVTRIRNHGYSVLYIAMSVTALGRRIRNTHEARSLLGFNLLEQHIQQVWLHSSTDMNVYTHQLDGDNLHNLFSGLDAAIAELKPHSVHYLLQFPGWWPIAKMLREKHGGKVIFDCMDDHAGFSTNTPLALQTEHELIKNADLVVASSGVLEQKIRPLNKNTVQVKNGTEFEHFNDAKPNGLLDHLADRPIIGYYGAISDWFDMDIVSHCATQHPEWNFVLIGSTFGADLTSINKLDNVHLLGEKKYSDLPGYLAYFDVCTIPFKIIPLTLATNPVKFYEYLSSGKPVVSVALLELLPYSEACYLANNAEEFETLLKLALSEKDDVQKISRRLEIAKENSWDSRAISIINAMESC